MKRINPITNKPFCHGEQRVDGYFFKGYGKKVLLNGFFIEHWHSLVAWEKLKLKKINYYNKNKQKIIEKQKQYIIFNKDNYKNYQKEYAKSEKKKQYFLKYREKNKEIIAKRIEIYRQQNLPKILANNAKRKLLQKNRMPKWLSKLDQNAITDFYIKAKKLSIETGVLHHVDHIVPLQGKNVSGLHVPWNLQVLTAKQNIAKSNKF